MLTVVHTIFNRLTESLLQREKEYQMLLRQMLEQKTQDLHFLQQQLKTTGRYENVYPDVRSY